MHQLAEQNLDIRPNPFNERITEERARTLIKWKVFLDIILIGRRQSQKQRVLNDELWSNLIYNQNSFLPTS